MTTTTAPETLLFDEAEFAADFGGNPWATDEITPELAAARLGDNQTAHMVWDAMRPLLDDSEIGQRFRNMVPVTPLLRIPDEALPADIRGTEHQLYLLADGHMPSGAYKFRGVVSALLRSLEQDPGLREVVVASTGNHAAASALAATLLGLECTVYMPEDAVAAKVENTEQYGSTVAFQSSLTQALSAARQRGERPGSVFMHPYDQLEVIAGQGTAAAELTGQLAEYGVDLGYEDEVELYEPIGGGGVATGNGVAQKMLMPKAQLHVVQAQNADALVARLQGRQFDARTFNPAVDGAAVLQPGQYALSALGTPGFVQSAHVVSRGAVGEAMAVTGRMEGRFAGLYEPAGALALAAVIAAVRRNPADRSVKIAHGTGINTTPQKVQEFAVAARNEQLLTDAAMWDMISLANMDSRRALNDTELLGRALAAERAGRLAVRGGCRVASGR